MKKIMNNYKNLNQKHYFWIWIWKVENLLNHSKPAHRSLNVSSCCSPTFRYAQFVFVFSQGNRQVATDTQDLIVQSQYITVANEYFCCPAGKQLLWKHHAGNILDPVSDPVFFHLVSPDTRQDKHFLAWQAFITGRWCWCLLPLFSVSHCVSVCAVW